MLNSRNFKINDVNVNYWNNFGETPLQCIALSHANTVIKMCAQLNMNQYEQFLS